MEKEKQVVIVDDEEPKHNRVICNFKYVLYILRRFFRYVEEYPDMFPFTVNVKRDVVLLQAFLTHRPQELDEEDDTLEEIQRVAHQAAMVISMYDLDDMDERKAWELVEIVNSNLTAMSRMMDLIRVIYGEETDQLRVCFDTTEDILQPYLDSLLGPALEDQEFNEDISAEVLSELGRFLQYVGGSRGFMVSVPGMRQVYDDVALLQAFLTDCPQQFSKNGRLMEHIVFLARKVECTILRYNPRKEMDQHKALKLVKSLNSLFKDMSHWMDLIRIIYGKHPRAPPPVYCFVDNLAPLDAVLDYYFEPSPLILNDSRMKDNIEAVVLLRAILMDPPPQNLIEDGTLKGFGFVAREVGFTFSSIDLNSMDYDMANLLFDRLTHIFRGPQGLLERLQSMVKVVYIERLKPSRMYYPKIAQLDFVDLLADNLGELLLKAKADNASLIRLLRFDILRLKRNLQEVSCRLTEIPEPRKQEADLKDSITNITTLAYEAEYVIDSVLLADIPIWCSMLWLRDILQELEEQLALIKMGFGDTKSIVQNIIQCLVYGKHQILPIFHNNSEIGDTGEKVFNEIKIWMDVRTRSLVSSYTERKKEVLLDLLRNAENDGIKNEIDYSNYTINMSEAELEESVYNLLKEKDYVVLLEDVQDIYALNDIKRVLPESQGYASVILFTTPFSEFVVQTRYGFHQISQHHPSTSQTDTQTIEKDVVGFKEETKRMHEHLIGESNELLIISIVGTAGQGKTTLATKLFNHPSVKEYFYTRAWCCVSQVYEKRQLLLELLSQVVQLSETDHHRKNDVELAEMLYKQLKRQRFLICLDDVWKIDAWNDLARCFPNDKNGSRIIFTTRIQELACQAKSSSILQPLGLLSDKESWELLQKKLFLNECCPIKLLEIGRKIAENCKGLPLAVVLIAGLLQKMERKVDHWERIVKNLCSLILNDSDVKGEGVIELSYNHLPDHLKLCFLYFGVFLEDREVQVSNLIRLWIGEGFVKHSESKSLEDVAEDYIGDLIGRSLVTIVQEKSNGGVKSCRIHDLLREFCLTKANKENFLQLLDGYDEQNLSFGQDPNNSSSSTGIKYHIHRLCIYPKRNHFTKLKPFGPFVRSLLFFAASDMCPSYSSDILFIFHNFKFLKTLNLEGINVGNSFKEIGALILLRYLACLSDVDLIPSSIANLWNLQTFVFKGLGAEVVNVSDSLWNMIKLRHLHISKSASFDLGPDRLENSSILDNLQTFSTPSLAYGDDTEKMLRKVQRIRKLKCIFLDSWNEAINCYQFPNLGFLSQLVSLNVFYNGKAKYPCEFYFPSNLKKLTLSNFRMPWNEISQVAQLCKLEVLKLLDNAFEGETWEMENLVFRELKFLKLDTLNVVKWFVASDSFPFLRCLVVHNCKQLEEIPLEIGEIPTLQMIEAMWCSRSVAISAKKIEVDQLDYGNEVLKIHVHPQVWDIESLS